MKSMHVPIVLLAFGISLSAVPSQAQTTTTNCLHVGQQLYCNSYTQQSYAPPAPNYGALLQSQQQQAQQLQQAQSNLIQAIIARRQRQQAQQAEEAREREAEQARAQEADFRVSLGKMIENGNCAGAKAMALDSGRLDLVPLVNQACAAPAPAPAPAPTK